MALRILDNGESNRSVNEDAAGEEYRNISMSHQQYAGNAFVLRFPWRDSFFYYGMTSLLGYGRFGYNEKVTGYTLSERSANVEWEQYYADISLPIGFSVNYEKLGTLLCGVGPRKRLWTNRNFIDTGAHHDVDANERDATIRAFDKETENIGLHFMAMWGVSF